MVENGTGVVKPEAARAGSPSLERRSYRGRKAGAVRLTDRAARAQIARAAASAEVKR